MATAEEIANLRINELKLNAGSDDGDNGCEENEEWKSSCQAEEVENIIIIKDDEGNYAEDSADKTNLAPMEISAECLSAFMSRDYESALFYCGQILQYEPDNKTAQEFYQLIQRKIKIESEIRENRGEDSDSFEDDMSDSEEESTSSNNFSSSSSSKKSSDEDKDEESDFSEYDAGGSESNKVASKFRSDKSEESSDDSI